MKLRNILAIGGAAALAARAIVRHRRAFDVRGRTVAIMGGSRGLGLVLARELLARGARVALCARDEAELARAKAELAATAPPASIFTGTCDVADFDSVLAFITTVEDDFGAIDVLINNAGVIQVGPIEAMTATDFDRALDINLRGPLNSMLATLPRMRARGEGRIVNIASIGGKLAMPHLAPYCTSKFALVGLSQGMRAELAKDNIAVTTVCPGLVRTGSPRHAWFKGQRDAEYAWFTLGDSSTLTSVSAETAARRIIGAMVHGDAELVISLQAKIAAFAAGVAPSLVQAVLARVARLLPEPAAAPGDRMAVQGMNIGDGRVDSWFASASDKAARRNNEN